ncbi:hypothetical protein GMD78_17700 [Ornithinibacillus sp. L9]|uniref:YtkA-like domain-containing protein n=1 Tax=Ornithinibacillus caprae TaxID=2678566 RepID=A0A6N8FKN1_9BACI|nr:FixH family protein [Ornithinibacillus caprae]MUK90210.1 hypothetical protein [Ornithinibacillus caprae]
MTKKTIWIFSLILFFSTILVACNDEEKDMNEMPEEDDMAILEVDLQVPDSVEVNETLEMKAVVTYGDEMVSDADEVEYEVWEEGQQEDSYRIEATNHGDGTYTAETSFEQDGIFHIQVHVTARDLHTMPKQEVTVGEGGEYPDEEDQDSTDEHHDESGHSHSEEASEGFTMEFTELDPVQVMEEINLTVQLKMDNKSLTNAKVQYEIWNDTISDKHEWIPAEEKNPGEYHATHQFSDPGEYNIQVHVENDEGLHEHETYELEVK